MDKIQDNGIGISAQGIKINNLRLADDIDPCYISVFLGAPDI